LDSEGEGADFPFEKGEIVLHPFRKKARGSKNDIRRLQYPLHREEPTSHLLRRGELLQTGNATLTSFWSRTQAILSINELNAMTGEKKVVHAENDGISKCRSERKKTHRQMDEVLKMHDLRAQALKEPDTQVIEEMIVVTEAKSRGSRVVVNDLYDLKAIDILFTD
jgi:hypothetical protein